MTIKSATLLIFFAFVFSSCNMLVSEDANFNSQATQTKASADMATSMMEEARRELMEDQTVTAAVEIAVERALATSVSEAVAETLTALAPTPVNTPTQLEILTDTPTVPAMPSETLTTDPTATYQPLPTTAAPQFCYHIIDDWCNTHKGCSTVDVRNQSGLNSSWHIWSDKEAIDLTFIIPAGPCTIEARPGKYNFYVTYCGDEVADFSWQLNDNWWYKISPCD